MGKRADTDVGEARTGVGIPEELVRAGTAGVARRESVIELGSIDMEFEEGMETSGGEAGYEEEEEGEEEEERTGLDLAPALRAQTDAESGVSAGAVASKPGGGPRAMPPPLPGAAVRAPNVAPGSGPAPVAQAGLVIAATTPARGDSTEPTPLLPADEFLDDRAPTAEGEPAVPAAPDLAKAKAGDAPPPALAKAGDVPPPGARGILGARPAAPNLGAAAPQPDGRDVDATVPVTRQGLPLPASLPVLGDDGVEPSPEYIAAREAALRAVRANKRLHHMTPSESLNPPLKPSEFASIDTSMPGDLATPAPHGSIIPGTGTGTGSSRISPAVSDRVLERSYTDALAAIDLDDDVSGSDVPDLGVGPLPSDPAEQSYPGASYPGFSRVQSSPDLRPKLRAPVVTPARQQTPAPAYPVPVPVAPAPVSAPVPAPGYQSPAASKAKAGLVDIYDDDDDEPSLPRPAQVVAPGAGSSSHWVQNAKRPKRIKRPRGPAAGYTGATLSRERNVVRMGLGLMIAGVGFTLLFWFLPLHAPLSAESPGVGGTAYVWRFSPELYQNAQSSSAGFIAVGLLFILNGLFFKPQSEIVCKRCKQYVIAQRDMVNMKCPRSTHVAGLCYTTVVLIVLLLGCVASTLVFVAQANIIRGG